MFKIAICDDEVKTAHELEHTIHELPFNNIETEVFLSGCELLNHYAASDSYNIVLLDIEMPSMNGIETAANLRKIDRNVVLIFVTAYKEYVYPIFETLPFQFLEKPVSHEKIFIISSGNADINESNIRHFLEFTIIFEFGNQSIFINTRKIFDPLFMNMTQFIFLLPYF